jgi:periplasmic protein TonB
MRTDRNSQMRNFLIILTLLFQINTFGQVFATWSTGPEYIGGQEAFNKFISQNLQLPDSVKNGLVDGVVFIKTIIAEDGTVTQAEILKGIKGCKQCDKEALRVAQLLPKHKPGTIDGKPIKTIADYPIRFKKP